MQLKPCYFKSLHNELEIKFTSHKTLRISKYSKSRAHAPSPSPGFINSGCVCGQYVKASADVKRHRKYACVWVGVWVDGCYSRPRDNTEIEQTLAERSSTTGILWLAHVKCQKFWKEDQSAIEINWEKNESEQGANKANNEREPNTTPRARLTDRIFDVSFARALTFYSRNFDRPSDMAIALG